MSVKQRKITSAKEFLQYVFTEKGSVKNYNDEVGVKYITDYVRDNYGIELPPEYVNKFVKERSDEINKIIGQRANRARFKVIRGSRSTD